MNRRGFTLMEVVVALSALSLVALLLHRGVAEVREMGERAAEHRGRAAAQAAVRREVAGWLRGTYVDPGFADPARARAFEGTNGAAGEDRLAFRTTTAGWRRTGALEVRLSASPGAGLVAEVRDDTEPGVDGRGAEARRVVLVPEADGIEIRYLLDVGGERRWVDTWSTTVRPPVAVELRILGARVPPLLRVPLLVTLPGE